MTIRFRNLVVWEKAMGLAERVYGVTERFPRSEMYGLTSQVRRAALSIPSNIAEGKAIGGQSYPHHLRIALGSQAELETQIELARRLAMLTESEAAEMMERTSEVGRMLVGLLNALPKP